MNPFNYDFNNFGNTNVSVNFYVSRFYISNIYYFNDLIEIVKTKEVKYFNLENYLDVSIENLQSTSFKEISNRRFLNTPTLHSNSNFARINHFYKQLNQNIEIHVTSWLNTLNGKVDFGQTKVNYFIDNSFKLQYRLYYYFHSIENINVEHYKIPAIIYSVYNEDSFLAFIDYLGLSNKTHDIDVYKAYLKQFLSLRKSSNIESKVLFIINTPRKIIEKIITENSENLVYFRSVFQSLLSSKPNITNQKCLLLLMDILAYRSSLLDSPNQLAVALTNFLNYISYNTLNGKIYFEVLYNFFTNQNFNLFINQFYAYWIYSDLNNPENNLFKNFNTSPSQIAYKNQKILLFSSNEYSFKLSKHQITLERVTSKLTFHNDLNKGTTLAYKSIFGKYHIFQPIDIVELNDKGELVPTHNVKISEYSKLELPASTIPAFFLKAIDDQHEWELFKKQLWLAFDVGITFTGIGNLAKLRYLRYFSKLDKARIVLGGVEFTSGILGIMLRFSDACTSSEFCQKFRTMLLYLEIAAGATDLVITLLSRNLAKDIVSNHSNDIYKHAANESDATQINKKLTELANSDGKHPTNLIKEVKNGSFSFTKNADGTFRNPRDFTRYSNFAEAWAHEKWILIKKWKNGKPVNFKPIHQPITDIDTPIRKGIDNIFENTLFDGKSPPPKYVISEVKFHTRSYDVLTPSKWRNKLSKTKHGRQMDDKWIEKKLREMFDELKVRDILNNHESYLTGISKNGDKVEIFQLTDNATKIKTINL